MLPAVGFRVHSRTFHYLGMHVLFRPGICYTGRGEHVIIPVGCDWWRLVGGDEGDRRKLVPFA